MSLAKKRNVCKQIIRLFAGFFCFAAGVSFAAENEKPAKTAAAPQPIQQQQQQQKPDPFVVPDGTPAELYAYIKGLDNLLPERRDRKSIIEFIIKLGKARIEGCEKILASAAPLQEKRPAAVMLLSTTTQMAIGLGDPQAVKTLAELPARFEKLGMFQIAAAARASVLQMNLNLALQGAPGAPPLDDVIKELKLLVEKNPNTGALRMLMAAIDGMSQTGKTARASGLCKFAVEVFGSSKDPAVLGFLENIKGIGRRLELPGKTMVVKGPLIDGKPYDLAGEKGKVVLVQYWATWCEPCLREIANVMKYYPLYHDRGFDVIGISIDEDKAQLEEFLKKNKLPWPVMLDSQAEDSNARRYGVTGIPMLILVDRQGKVVSLEARGENLGRELEKLLGPAEKADQHGDAKNTEVKK